MERNYKGLALQQDKIDEYIQQYLDENTNVKIRSNEPSTNKQTIKFGYTGVDDALVVLHFMSTGLTTIQFKTGKNQPLGKTFADHLFETVNPDESLVVNLSIKGIDKESLQLIFEELASMVDAGSPEFTLTYHQPTEYSSSCLIESIRYKDKLTITHHTTNVLQIQGRPLYSYRNIVFVLSSLLDQEALLAVISKTSDEDRTLVRAEVAKNYIEKEFCYSFLRMPVSFQNLLISSYCVKLAAPNLPEYSMLLYSDLRVLEGVIKQALALHGKNTDTVKIDIGDYFTYAHPKSWTLKECHWEDFESQNSITAIEECYELYNIQRHSLFHMSEIADSTRMISTIGTVLELSADIAIKIESLYKNCQKL